MRMRRLLATAVVISLTVVGPIVATSATPAAAQAPACSASGPPTVAVFRNAVGGTRARAHSGNWTCTPGTTPQVLLQLLPVNPLVTLLIPSLAGAGAGTGSVAVNVETGPNLFGILLLRPPTCFVAVVTVTGIGAQPFATTATAQGCG